MILLKANQSITYGKQPELYTDINKQRCVCAHATFSPSHITHYIYACVCVCTNTNSSFKHEIEHTDLDVCIIIVYYSVLNCITYSSHVI